MIPEFEKVAFSLKEGKCRHRQDPVRLSHNQADRQAASGIRPFDEVKDQIKAALLPEKQQEVFKKLKEDLKRVPNFPSRKMP